MSNNRVTLNLYVETFADGDISNYHVFTTSSNEEFMDVVSKMPKPKAGKKASIYRNIRPLLPDDVGAPLSENVSVMSILYPGNARNRGDVSPEVIDRFIDKGNTSLQSRGNVPYPSEGYKVPNDIPTYIDGVKVETKSPASSFGISASSIENVSRSRTGAGPKSPE